ncbi:MAG: hypothetical protein EOP05_13655, partial [Proteobacteria bacterium]
MDSPQNELEVRRGFLLRRAAKRSRAPMEIKDPIHGSIEVNSAEVAVLDSMEFQRLRSIKQL